MKHVNSNLITLKCVLFLFFGALGCLFPFLPLHMTSKGLSSEESKTISIVAPCIALLGPGIAGPLADRLAGGLGGKSRSKTGKYLRVMIAICFILAAIFYWLLTVVPTVVRGPPSVTFSCDKEKGLIYQERCSTEQSCYNWGGSRGSLYVHGCRFACESQPDLTDVTTIYPDRDVSTGQYDYNENDYNEEDVINSGDGPIEVDITYSRYQNMTPHPHLCYKNDNGDSLCEVYTKYSHPIKLHVDLHTETGGDEMSDRMCKYSIGSDFSCRITAAVERNLTRGNTSSCHPVVKCNIYEPYNVSSMLKVTECGYNNISFWLYLFIRSFADMFPAAAVALLNTAVVIATRETSTGRGDVGKQLAAGALGFAIFAPACGAIDKPIVALIIFSVMLVIGAIILLLDNKMPLSPPEWWWHTRCGLLALPMSSIKKYSLEIGSLSLILVILGIFWSAIDSFMPWHIFSLSGTPLIVGLTITAGSLPAVIFLMFAEEIVDYCGHTNLLITSFVFYILHFVGIPNMENAATLLILEAFEIFTLHLMWITAVLYYRHLMPKKFTASGQALAVITHFCIGRFLGALIGGIAYSGDRDTFENVHMWFALAAAIIAIIYFVSYHLYLKPRYAAPTQRPPRPAPALVQSMNGNGSYTPLRVYHNGRAKKGQFRY